MNTTRNNCGARLSWLGVAAMAAMTTAFGASVAGAELVRTEPSAPPVTETTIDRLVRPDDADVLSALLTCRAGVSGNADVQERWTETCRTRAFEQATVIAFEARCRTGISASADVSEAWWDVCRQRAVSQAAAQTAHLACVRAAPSADTAERTCRSVSGAGRARR